MKRIAIVLVASLATQLGAESITPRRVKARDFVSQSTAIVRATAISEYELRVTSVLFGTKHKVGDVVTIEHHGCCSPVVGREYYVETFCRTDCGSAFLEKKDVAGDVSIEDYIKAWHVVTRAEVLAKLGQWLNGDLATDKYARWLATADANDNDVDGQSLTLPVIDEIEDVMEFLDDAKTCAPASVEQLRVIGGRVLLERFARLPKQEKLSEYEVFFDEHEDTTIEWPLPSKLHNDIDAELQKHPLWVTTSACVDERWKVRYAPQ